ncbi:MAG: hypothetical protein ABI977_19625 [Acidobacteriota bacterium]
MWPVAFFSKRPLLSGSLQPDVSLVQAPISQISTQRLMLRAFILASVIGTALAINLVLRHPDSLPNGPLEQSVFDWSAMVISEALYWGLNDLIWGAWWLLERWWSINNPIFKIGILFGAVMVGFNVYLGLRGWQLHRRMSIFCPIDNSPGRPIAGTYNRYRCIAHNHQFNGDSHGIQ